MVKLVQESIFEACYLEMGIGRGGGMQQTLHGHVGGQAQSYSGAQQSSAGQGGRGKGKFQDPNNVGMLSIPKQTKFYVERLRGEAGLKGSPIFDYQELVRLGKEINLQVGDFRTLVDKLNSQGILIMKAGRQY